MIELKLPAEARCDAHGCRNDQPVTLVLMASGGFGVLPRSTAWQLALTPTGVIMVRCPEHRVAAPPVIPDAAPVESKLVTP